MNAAQPAGSPPKGGSAFLAVGKLLRSHGLRGEIVMDVLTDFPERLRRGVVVYVGEEHQAMRIRSRRAAHTTLLLSFDGYDTPEAVSTLRNQYVYVRAEDRPPLPEGEYYHHQLIGLRVVAEDGQPLGELTQILETGANDVYVVRPEGGADILLPAIESVVLDINLEQGVMRVHVLPGLLPEE